MVQSGNKWNKKALKLVPILYQICTSQGALKMSKWQKTTVKGLEVRAYSKTETVYRFRQSVKGKNICDYFGMMPLEQAQTLAAQLKFNRKAEAGPQTYKEMQGEVYEQEQASYIKEQQENKRIIAQDAFDRQNSISYFFDNIYFPYRSQQGNAQGIKKVKQNFDNYWRDSIGHMPLTEFKYTDIERVLKNMEAKGRSPQTIKHIYNTLQALYNYAKIYFSAHYSIALPEFCGKILKLKQTNNEKTCFLNYDEANTLLDALYNWPAQNGTKDVYGMAILSLYSGLRFGDITRLKWRDVEGDIAYAHQTKSGHSYGVHLNIKPIQDMLAERKGFFPNRQAEDLIFINQHGQQYKEPPKLFERTAIKLGLNETPRRKGDKYEKITFHSLRHTFASWLAIEGVDLYVIRALMGHNDIKMTQRYAKLSKDFTEKHVAQIAHHYQSNQNIIDI